MPEQSIQKGSWFYILHQIVKDIPSLAMQEMQIMKAGPKCGIYTSDDFLDESQEQK